MYRNNKSVQPNDTQVVQIQNSVPDYPQDSEMQDLIPATQPSPVFNMQHPQNFQADTDSPHSPSPVDDIGVFDSFPETQPQPPIHAQKQDSSTILPPVTSVNSANVQVKHSDTSASPPHPVPPHTALESISLLLTDEDPATQLPTSSRINEFVGQFYTKEAATPAPTQPTASAKQANPSDNFSSPIQTENAINPPQNALERISKLITQEDPVAHLPSSDSTDDATARPVTQPSVVTQAPSSSLPPPSEQVPAVSVPVKVNQSAYATHSKVLEAISRNLLQCNGPDKPKSSRDATKL